MCSKMARLYSRFIGEMQERDPLLKILVHMCGTLAHETDSNGNPRGYTGMTSSGMCPSTHGIVLNCGSRQSNWDNVVVRMTAAQYNEQIKPRISGSQEARALVWRNYLIDNGLVHKLIEILDRQISSRSIDSSYQNWVTALKIKMKQTTHERIAA